MCRSVPASVLVILPKAESPKPLSGKLNWGVLVRLKTSVRNCNRKRSVNAKSLNTDKSRFRSGGPLFVLSPIVPCVRDDGAVKFAVLNHCDGVRPPAGAALGLAPDTRSGKQPAHTPWQPPALTVYGWPVCSVRMPLTCQLPNARSTALLTLEPHHHLLRARGCYGRKARHAG